MHERAHDPSWSLPGSAAYDAGRLAASLDVDQRPIAVATPTDLNALRAVLRRAEQVGATVLPRAGGHGTRGDATASVVVRTDAFTRLEVDAKAGLARIGAGVRWRDAAAALDRAGAYLPPMGTSGEVSCVGLLLGGGHGWSARRSGIAASALRRVRVMTAEGEDRWIEQGDPAMRIARGAGAVLGIVTEVEIALDPVTSLIGGTLQFAIEDAPAIIDAARALAPEAPEGLGLTISLVAFPDAPVVPAPLRGTQLVQVHALLADLDPRALARLRAAAPVVSDSTGPLTASHLPTITNDPPSPSFVTGRSALVPVLDDAMSDALVRARQSPDAAPAVAIQLRMLGGALDRDPQASMASTRGAEWLVHAIAPYAPHDAARAVGGLDAIWQRVDHAPGALGALTLPTFLATSERWSRAFTDVELDAIRAQRDAWDPAHRLALPQLPRGTRRPGSRTLSGQLASVRPTR